MRRVLSISLFLLVFTSVVAGNRDDEEAIRQLIHEFVTSQRAGADGERFLSPSISAEQRDTQARSIRGPYVRYEVYDIGRIVVAGSTATVKARLLSQTPSSEFDKPVTLRFEKVGTDWYFATYEDLQFPRVLVALISLAAVVYAAASLGMWYHVSRRKFKHRLLWEILVLTPVGWILYPVFKPWTQATTA